MLAHSPKIVMDGLVLCLDAGNGRSYPGSGTTWSDLSGNGNNGTLTNGVSYNNDNGGSLVFDGVNQYASITQNNIYKFSNSDPFSISVWCKITASSFSSFISFALTGGRGYYFTFDKNGLRTNSFLFDYFDGSTFRGIQGNSNSIITNSWINLVATSENNTVSGMKVYQNGILTSFTNRGSGTPNSINYDTLTMSIGARGSGSYFNGNITSASIYNRALSQDEIKQNFNATRGRFGL